MKYVVTWQARDNASEASVARSLQVFSKWAPSEGVTYHEFLGNVDGTGGLAVVESDDVALVAKDVAPWGVWFDIRVTPVLEIAEASTIGGEAVAFLASIS